VKTFLPDPITGPPMDHHCTATDGGRQIPPRANTSLRLLHIIKVRKGTLNWMPRGASTECISNLFCSNYTAFCDFIYK